MKNTEFNKFDSAVRQILSVSREELQRREEQWQRERDASGHAKPGPKPHAKRKRKSRTSA